VPPEFIGLWRGIHRGVFMKKVFLALSLIFLFVGSNAFSLDMVTWIRYNSLDMYAKRFDSASPADIFNDVKEFLPNAHKNRSPKKTEQINLFWGKTREQEYIINETGGRIFDDFMLSSPTYTLAAYIWFANNDEGYIMLVIDDGSLGDYKLFHYILK
jgi:hypothetical protein